VYNVDFYLIPPVKTRRQSNYKRNNIPKLFVGTFSVTTRVNFYQKEAL